MGALIHHDSCRFCGFLFDVLMEAAHEGAASHHKRGGANVSHLRNVSTWLWVDQWLLALFFALASGAPKLLLPAEALPMPIPIPAALLKFIGTAEVLGALGLILPGLTRIRPGLTPLAALGLVLVTICATAYQLMADQPGSAIFAFGIGCLAALIAYGRWQVAPLPGRSDPSLRSAA